VVPARAAVPLLLNHLSSRSRLNISLREPGSSYALPRERRKSRTGRSRRRNGLLVVSLDFELYWGVREMPNVHRYYGNLVGARNAVSELLKVFSNYGIHATWAIVGFLYANSTSQLRDYFPTRLAAYQWPSRSPYDDLPAPGVREDTGSIFFAPSLIRQISDTAHQEIATHTFSHYYCMQAGSDVDSFRADLAAARAIAGELGLTCTTLVFPKNQCADDYIDAASIEGLRVYRGNPSSWLHQANTTSSKRVLLKAARLLDGYLPISAVHAQQLSMDSTSTMTDIPSSRFLRPFVQALSPFESVRLDRIKLEMKTAAETGQIYHLWWHPHNFGLNTEANIGFLIRVLDYYRELNDSFGFESANMCEALSLSTPPETVSATVD
jgi:Polysaccharide deacetylase